MQTKRRYHHSRSHGDFCTEIEVPDLIILPLVITTLLIFIYALLLSLILFLQSLSPIVRIEIQMDYLSSPITSILPNGVSGPTLPTPLCYYSKVKKCVSSQRSLLNATTIDKTRLSVRYMEHSYKELLESTVKKGEQFAEGEKKCGILDTFSNIMCVNKEEECPINLVVINTEENAPSGSYAFTTIKLDSLYLHYTNEAIDDYVVSKFIKKETLKIDVSPFNTSKNENDDFFIANSCEINSTLDTNATFYKNIGNDIFIRPFIGRSPNVVIFTMKANSLAILNISTQLRCSLLS